MSRATPLEDGVRPQDQGCALVTGASRGIGAAVAEALARGGWPVVVNYRSDRDGALETVRKIDAAGGRALPIEADVADPAAVDRMFEQTEDELGPALVVVNNAGARHDRLTVRLEPENWSHVIEVNLTGTFLVMRRALQTMVRRRFGRIVNVSSVSATRTLPGQASYAASKAGVEALTKTAAVEVARRGITVNAVAPGLVATGFVSEMTDEWATAMPSRRIAEPEEVAHCVSFLVSEGAEHVSGTVLSIDGALGAGLAVLSRRPRAAASVEREPVEG